LWLFSSSSVWSISLSMFCNTGLLDTKQVRLTLSKKSLFIHFDCRIAFLYLVSKVGNYSPHCFHSIAPCFPVFCLC
jgi:hypothetical protein